MARRRPEPGTLILAADGGNSKAELALATANGTLLGTLRGPTVSHQVVGLEAGMDRLERQVARLMARSGRTLGVRPAVDLAFLCLAGADFPHDIRSLEAGASARGWASRVLVRNDGFAALRAGAERGWGVAVICGAGVQCVGLRPDGGYARLPALGPTSGDWGGGNSVGLAGLMAAVRARDGRGARTSLERRVPDHFGLRRPFDVTRAIYEGRISESRLGELSPIVFAAASAGDSVAREIVDRLAEELATMAVAMIRRLRMARRDVDVVLAGGIFRTRDRPLYARLEEGVRRAIPAARVRPLRVPPVLGALLLGLDELGGADRAAAERRLRAAFAAAHRRGRRGPANAAVPCS